MYLPPHFREDDVARLHEAMRANAFATIVLAGDERGPVASHVPTLLDSDPPPYGTLLFHFARGNPHWHGAAGKSALAIFLGPHAYVSPSAYPTKTTSGKVVPTWNYIAVHARGPLEVLDDADEVRAIVTRLTAENEASRATQWSPGDAPTDYIAGQLKGIVGLRMRIEQLEGKWKLGQNRPQADRLGAVADLEASARVDDRATAQAMRETLDRSDTGLKEQ